MYPIAIALMPGTILRFAIRLQIRLNPHG